MSWGLVSQAQVLKVEVPNVGFKPFAPQGEAHGCVPSRLWVSALHVGFLVTLCSTLPHPLHCGLPLISLVQMSCSVSRFSSEEIFQYVATDSVCLWKEMSPRSS